MENENENENEKKLNIPKEEIRKNVKTSDSCNNNTLSN